MHSMLSMHCNNVNGLVLLRVHSEDALVAENSSLAKPKIKVERSIQIETDCSTRARCSHHMNRSDIIIFARSQL